MRWSLGTGRRQMALVGILLCLVTGCDRGLQPGQLGRQAPEFQLDDGTHSVNLAALRGQVVVLNFWATWCAPCLQELPSLEALQRQMPQIKVVAVATDEDLPTYQSFLRQRPVALFTILDTTQRSNTMYGTFAFPETYIIDKGGRIRRKLISAQDWTSPEIVNQLRELAG